jgi:D-alanine-D-alanine ligase
MGRRRILLLVHPEFRPDRHRKANSTAGRTERDVWRALKVEHHVEVTCEVESLRELDQTLVRSNPDLVFNLLEEFGGEAVYDFHPVSYIESLGIPVTGCNPRGLVQSRNKFLVMQVAEALGIACPKTFLLRRTADLKQMQTNAVYPMFVKLNREHASLGICNSSKVRTFRALRAEVERMWKRYGGEVLAQEFIEGSDVTVSVWGNRAPQVFQPRRLLAKGRVLTERAKFNIKQQRRHGMRSVIFRPENVGRLKRDTMTLFKTLDLSGYARIDYRVAENGKAYLIDVNANPNLAQNEDFALSALHFGIEYTRVLTKIMDYARSYKVSL